MGTLQERAIEAFTKFKNEHTQKETAEQIFRNIREKDTLLRKLLELQFIKSEEEIEWRQHRGFPNTIIAEVDGIAFFLGIAREGKNIDEKALLVESKGPDAIVVHIVSLESLGAALLT